jgi:hypothetical protein
VAIAFFFFLSLGAEGLGVYVDALSTFFDHTEMFEYSVLINKSFIRLAITLHVILVNQSQYSSNQSLNSSPHNALQRCLKWDICHLESPAARSH